MKHFYSLFLFFVISFFWSPPSAFAASCSYGSTQARVQNNVNVPWSPAITVECEKSFRVGGFHNGTGQFATDVTNLVTGPSFFGAYFQNGDTVQVSNPGEYTLTVKTVNQEGQGCTEQAKISVVCPNPTSVPSQVTQCSYGSTQARVQNNVSVPWAPSIQVGCDRKFNVGSFHNGSGQFSSDTYLFVSGPGVNAYYGNGQTVYIPANVTQGNYSLSVTTANQTGPACSEAAMVSFACNPVTTVMPTPTPFSPSVGNQCPYTSTQSRVQQDSNQAWVKTLSLTCNQTFTVGSFHNNGTQFASDTRILVSDPYGYGVADLSPGKKIRAFFPGQYLVTTATPGKNGPQCADIATVNVSCNASPIPDFWKNILQQLMVI